MKYSNIFDTHAHFDDTRFNPDRDELLTTIHQNGVEHIMNIGCDEKTSLNSIKLAEKYDFIDCTIGIHPNEADKVSMDYIDILAKQAENPKVRAIGEIGLDYHWDVDHDIQMAVFMAQLELADSLDMPIVIHDREAHQDVLEQLKRFRPRGIVHCFSGSAEFAHELVKLGFYIGFTGAITFPNSVKAVRAVAAVPVERLLLETDSPYMAPQPVRGKRCDSSMIEHTAATMASIKDIDTQRLIDICNSNGKRIYEM
ncbi:MAG: TatD family hydrolase [Oscillospiraceae bacterium]